MMKIAFLVLAHNHPKFLANTCEKLLHAGHYVIVHYDKNSSSEDLTYLKDELSDYGERLHIMSEYHCAWGEWSLVAAPILGLEYITKLGWKIDYVHFMSGLEVPIKPLVDLENFLLGNPYDYIESVDISKERWVKGGLEIERLLYDFPYNFISNRQKFDDHYNWHYDNSEPRAIPVSIVPHMGSQWWTLRWETCKKILQFTNTNRDVVDLYKTSWIPDEGYFQTVVRSVVTTNEIVSTQLLYHHLLQTNGRPLVFMNGHEGILKKLPHFFVRKVSPESKKLINYIDDLTSGREEYQLAATVDNLKELKNEQDYAIYLKGNISVDTLWSDFNLNSKKYNQTCITILIHTQNVDTLHLNKEINKVDGSLYLGRPFRKKDDYLSHNIFSKVKRTAGIGNKVISEVEFINKLPFIFPHLKHIVFSYVPEFDWTDQEYPKFSCNLSSFIFFEDQSNIYEKSYLYEKLKYEKFQNSRYSIDITLQELIDNLK